VTILALDPAANRSPGALRAFLVQCQAAAVRAARAQLVSISISVDALDPLAVLESIFEPGERHFYVERPAERTALAGAEAVLAFTAAGTGRFAACQKFIDETLAQTLAVGNLALPFAGPHFFAAFTFADATEPGEAFESASVFVPRWQVALHEGGTVAVANLVIDGASDIDAVTEKLWRAHAKFGAFAYTDAEFSDVPRANLVEVAEVGPAGGYARAVQEALREIEQGSLQKIVLARAKDLASRKPFHPLRVLNGLRQRFGDCYAFSVANGRGQSFIGASPELLLRVGEGILATEALAGSARRGATASEDAAFAGALQREEKELREHRLVLDSIVEGLKSLGLAPEFPGRPSIRRFANVQHLHTPVRAALPKGTRLLDVLARLHPTPAVGGAPRELAISRIRELEPVSRGLYSGAIGWVDASGRGEFFVGLRSALIDGSKARLYAGAGIVAGSSPDNEILETEMKFSAMEEALRES
jgi:menaquinone-specific isochorismate synthase